MTRIALGFLGSGDKRSLYRITFSRLNTINLSPTYEVINIDTSSNDLTKQAFGFLGSSVDVLKNISDFPPVYPVGAKYFRLVRMEWTPKEDDKNVPAELTIRMANESIYKLVVKNKAETHQITKIYSYVSIGIFVLQLFVIFLLIKQFLDLKVLFVFGVPKFTLFYMLVGDILFFIHQMIFHKSNTKIPIILNLSSGVLMVALVIYSNIKFQGFKSDKNNLAFAMIVLISLVSCVGFYGDNFMIEILYSFFPMLVIFENQFVDIVWFNRVINWGYIPLKTLQVLLNMIQNDGWLVDLALWPVIAVYLLP
jgi:hypothetical protein